MTVNEWLGESNEIGQDIWNNKYKYGEENFEEWLDRVSKGDNELRQLIAEKKFLFGGRALSNRGLDNGSYFNCYSSGYCPDDFEEIMKLNSNLGLTYKAQGGQGVSLSKLRPKGTPIGNRYTSDGIIPFLELFNKTTEITSQAGSRKGALLVSLDIRHKQAEEFISIKSTADTISKANLSLEIDDEFMNAVKTFYETGEVITLHEKRQYAKNTIEYDVIPIKVYKLMMERAYDWAEPGCIFTNEFRNYNLMELDNDYQIETCNPCGEQPLAKNFCCNLGSINLSEFIIDEYSDAARIDFDKFKKAINISINALDILVDENLPNHPLQEQRDNSKSYRNIGLGLMGVGTALFKLKVKYGSEDSKKLIDVIFSFMFKEAVFASSELATIKGKFPKYKSCIFDSRIIKAHFNKEEIVQLKKTGLRNCSLLSIAPNGSIGTLLGITGGCEPEFAIKYTRKTDNLKESYDIYCNEAKYYMEKFNTKTLPDYFVCSADIDWIDRVDMQAIMQKHIDTAISSTVNLPNSATKEDIEKLYLYAWDKKIKGITIYRSGCKRGGILITGESSSEENSSLTEMPRGYIESVPNDLQYRKYKLQNACGNLYLFVGIDENEGKIYDIFTNTDGVGGCTINTQANSRLISAGLRGGVPLEYLIDQLTKSGSCPSFQYKRGKGEKLAKGKSCPSAIANVLKDIMKEFADYEYEEVHQNDVKKVKQEVEIKAVSKSVCPECNEELRFEGGCNLCPSCGWSACG